MRPGSRTTSTRPSWRFATRRSIPSWRPRVEIGLRYAEAAVIKEASAAPVIVEPPVPTPPAAKAKKVAAA